MTVNSIYFLKPSISLAHPEISCLIFEQVSFHGGKQKLVAGRMKVKAPFHGDLSGKGGSWWCCGLFLKGTNSTERESWGLVCWGDFSQSVQCGFV